MTREHFLQEKFGIINSVSFVILSIALIFSIVISFWILFPYSPITIKDISILEINPEKGYIIAGMEYNKSKGLIGEYTIGLADGSYYTLKSGSSNVKEGKGYTAAIISVPNHIPSGEYRVSLTIRYKVNPIKAITIVKESKTIYWQKTGGSYGK